MGLQHVNVFVDYLFYPINKTRIHIGLMFGANIIANATYNIGTILAQHNHGNVFEHNQITSRMTQHNHVYLSEHNTI